MFDIGIFEFLLSMAIGLLIIGPERLPQMTRQLSAIKKKVSSSYYQMKWQLEQEITNDDIKRLKELQAKSTPPEKADEIDEAAKKES